MRRFSACVLSVLVTVMTLAGPAIASQGAGVPLAAVSQQPKQTEPAAPPKPRPAPSPEETPKPTPTPIVEAPSRGGQLANVRLDVTITDQRASGQPTSKTVSLVLADRAEGRIRTTGDVRVATPGTSNYQMRSVVLNVDAYPEFTRDGRVRAAVTLEYRPVAAEATNEEQALTTISERIVVVLEDGKPLVVSQSADPSTDRRVRVELKATILK